MNIDALTKRDITSLTKDEAIVLKEHYENLSKKFTAYEQAVKVTLNSIYGAFGNKWFHFFNIDIAESITLQGQGAILYSEERLNLYFNELWHKDVKVHEYFNIKVVKVKKPSVIYIDTDSCYVQFEEMYESIEWLGDKLTIDQFIMKLYKIRLDGFITNSMEKYSVDLNTKNYLYFDLETISYSGIWLSKKKYLQDIAWIDMLDIDDRFKSLSKIKTIGFDIIQSSTPTIARKQLTKAVEILLSEKPTAGTIAKLVEFLKKSKKAFKLADIDHICFNKRTNNIDKYVIDDTNEFQLGTKCPANVRAAGFYNFLLNNNKKYKSKYQLNGNGEKLKIYHCKHNISPMFAYQTGEHPYEFAPEVDYEVQFEKSVIDPINRILIVLGLQTLNRNLIYSTSLF
jgi:DNA polymerase elongation subunit (family B)